MPAPRSAVGLYAGKTERERLEEGEAILVDWKRGVRTSELMTKYNLSSATIYRRMDAAIKARIAVTVDEYREGENAHLDDIRARLEQQHNAAEAMIQQGIDAEDMSLVERGMTHRLAALDRMLRLSERRAKLNGLDAPARADVTVTVTTPLDAEVSALVEELAR